jgi:hypothetical protein
VLSSVENVGLSFRLLEFAVRTMCYAELNKIDPAEFDSDLQLNLAEENVAYPGGNFRKSEDIVIAAQMGVGAAFASTAICLDCLLEGYKPEVANITALKSLVSAVRNAFSHGIAEPRWYIKPHKVQVLDLAFIGGPMVDLGTLNGQPFDYSQIGGLALWYRAKGALINAVQNP